MPCVHTGRIWIFRRAPSELSPPAPQRSAPWSICFRPESRSEWFSIIHEDLAQHTRRGRCAAAAATAQVTMKRHRENLHHTEPDTELSHMGERNLPRASCCLCRLIKVTQDDPRRSLQPRGEHLPTLTLTHALKKYILLSHFFFKSQKFQALFIIQPDTTKLWSSQT